VSSLDLRALLAALYAAEARFVLIGGVAVAAHGYVRATEDLDIVPDPSAENLRRLGDALVRMGATMPLAEGRDFVPRDDNARLARGESVTLDTGDGPLDIVQRTPGVPGFDELDLSRSPQAHEGSAWEQPGFGRSRSLA
jgi:hypothetical protein